MRILPVCTFRDFPLIRYERPRLVETCWRGATHGSDACALYVILAPARAEIGAGIRRPATAARPTSPDPARLPPVPARPPHDPPATPQPVRPDPPPSGPPFPHGDAILTPRRVGAKGQSARGPRPRPPRGKNAPARRAGSGRSDCPG